mmetsp:Transcript_24191/g.35841  ORF Transcript_24191/g.35841 Transcript_24191/m.35841 type:complete len:318 (+) Transcript_24191:2006-2959(+)
MRFIHFKKKLRNESSRKSRQGLVFGVISALLRKRNWKSASDHDFLSKDTDEDDLQNNCDNDCNSIKTKVTSSPPCLLDEQRSTTPLSTRYSSTVNKSLITTKSLGDNIVNQVPKAVNVLETKSIESIVYKKRGKKRRRRKRRLRPVWDLHWQCSEEGPEGMYTGDSYISSAGSSVAHGYGTLSFTNGDVYVGPFYNGAMHGSSATYYYSSRSCYIHKYVGSFKHNRRHGPGEDIYSSNLVAMDIPTHADDNCTTDSSEDEDEDVSIYDESKQKCTKREYQSLSSSKKKGRKPCTFSSIIQNRNLPLDGVPENKDEEF